MNKSFTWDPSIQPQLFFCKWRFEFMYCICFSIIKEGHTWRQSKTAKIQILRVQKCKISHTYFKSQLKCIVTLLINPCFTVNLTSGFTLHVKVTYGLKIKPWSWHVFWDFSFTVFPYHHTDRVVLKRVLAITYIPLQNIPSNHHHCTTLEE